MYYQDTGALSSRSLDVYHPQSSEAQRELEMPKKSYALRNRRGYMDSTFNDGLRIVLQWMELRRQEWERQLLKWHKELYMMRRMWYPRYYNPPSAGGLLPGGYNETGSYDDRDELNFMRRRSRGGSRIA